MRALRVGLLGIMTLAVAGACSDAAGERAAASPSGPVIDLCGPRHPSPEARTQAAQITEARTRPFRLHATVLSFDSGCDEVLLQRPLRHIRMLAAILRQRGRFVQGVAVPKASAELGTGTRVRYTTDRATARTRRRPLVRPIFDWRGIARSSVALLPGYPRGTDFVTFSLRRRASRAWCRFTAHHQGQLSPSVLDHVVLEDPALEGGRLCSDILSPNPPYPGPRFARTGALALYAYLRFGPLPFRWRSITIMRPRS